MFIFICMYLFISLVKGLLVWMQTTSKLVSVLKDTFVTSARISSKTMRFSLAVHVCENSFCSSHTQQWTICEGSLVLFWAKNESLDRKNKKKGEWMLILYCCVNSFSSNCALWRENSVKWVCITEVLAEVAFGKVLHRNKLMFASNEVRTHWQWMVA